MAAWWRWLALVGCIIAVIVLENVDAKGGRGGGTRGGGTRSGSRGGSSSSSRISSRFGTLSGVRRYSGSRYQSSYWGTGAAIGVLYGLSSYKRRRRYLSSPNTEPTVCFNENTLRNSTYGFFICPEPDQPDDYEYCCGDEGNQECCQYFDSDQGKGAIVGIIVGVLIGTLVIIVVVFIVVKKYKSRRSTASSSGGTGYTSQPGVQYTSSSGLSGMSGVQSKDTPQPLGFDGYSDRSTYGDLSYSTEPQGPPNYTSPGYPPQSAQQNMPPPPPYPAS